MKFTKVVVPVVFSLGLGITIVALENQNNNNSQLKLSDLQVNAATNSATNDSQDNTVDNSVYDTSEQSNTDTTNTDTTSTDSSQPPVIVNGKNISIGESMQDVISALGRPYDDNKTIVPGDTQDQLVYTNMLHEQEYYIYCDNNLVTGIQDMK